MKAHAWVRALIACNLLTFAVIIGCGCGLVAGAAAGQIDKASILLLGAVVATLSAAFLVLNWLTLRLADGNWEEEAPATLRPRKAPSSAAWRADWNRKTEDANEKRRGLN